MIVADVAQARADAVRLTESEARRLGLPMIAPAVLEAVSRDSGVARGTIFNLVKNRVKGVRAAVRDRLAGAVIRKLERDIKALEAELAVRRLVAHRPDDVDVGEVEALLAVARRKIMALRGADES